MIQGIFYARFLSQEGTKIVAQSPPGCIVAAEYTPHLKPPLVDFDIVREYIIPRKAFFNRFVTTATPDGRYSILGFPVSIVHERYNRNEFIFNFGLVVESDVDQIPYERLVRRLALIFAEMERQSQYLSSEGRIDDGRRPIESVLEIVKEDLNNFGECMIPIGEANTINMKLFPYHAPPAAVHGWHVPVPKTKLLDIVDSTWDLTLQRIIPYVDGVNDVRRIAWLADVSLPLTQCALQHLLYYDTVLLLDMFFFGSCYAPRPGIHDFVANRGGMIDECAAYVCISPPSQSPPPAATPTKGGHSGSNAIATNRGRSDGENNDVASSLAMSGAGTAAPSISISQHTPTPENPLASGQLPHHPHPRAPSPSSLTTSFQQSSNTPIPNPNPNPNPNNLNLNLNLTPLLPLSSSSISSSPSGASSSSQTTSPNSPTISNYQLIKLMTTFCAGRSIMEWIRLHQQQESPAFDVLRHIDVRRLVQFGVVKGLLYRVHKFAVSKAYIAALATGRRTNNSNSNGKGNGNGDTTATTTTTTTRNGNGNGTRENGRRGLPRRHSSRRTIRDSNSKKPTTRQEDEDGGLEMRVRRRGAARTNSNNNNNNNNEDSDYVTDGNNVTENENSGGEDGYAERDVGDESGHHDDEETTTTTTTNSKISPAREDEILDQLALHSHSHHLSHHHNNNNNNSNIHNTNTNTNGTNGNSNSSSNSGESEAIRSARRKMLRYADGQHPFDQIITEQNLTDAEILGRLKQFQTGDVALLYR